MWWICAILLALFADTSFSRVAEAECLTADGSAGQCTAASECSAHSYSWKPVMCRYSMGRGPRICCPGSYSHFPHHLASERQHPHSNGDPIAFPSEFGSTNYNRPFYHQTTDPFNNRPFTDNSNYRPFTSSTHQRPIHNERPSYETATDYSYNSRPSYSGRPVYNGDSFEPAYSRPDLNKPSSSRPEYNRPSNSRPDYDERPALVNRPHNNRPSYTEKPEYIPDSRPSFTRPRPNYNERPEDYGGSLYGSQGRPNNFGPEPDVHGSAAGSAWDYPTTKRTTPRPSWAVETETETYTPTPNRRRISVRKCEEFSRAVTETIGVLPLSLDSEAVPLTVQKCDFSAIKLIVGGEAAELGEFPHMAAIGFPKSRSSQLNWNCGGTLISEDYVLTAAHCVNTSFGNPIAVRLGEYNLLRDNDGADPEDYGISKFIVHPNYRKNRKYDDIALLRLSRPVRFTKSIRPACLNTDDYVRGNPTATGWGRTDFVGKLSDILMKVNLNVINNRQCNSFYNKGPGTQSFSSGIIDTMLCAGALEGGRDTCLGDSGGPLTINKNDNPCIHHVVGVTSFGKVCGAPNSPGVYTRVSKYISWIERIVWPNLK